MNKKVLLKIWFRRGGYKKNFAGRVWCLIKGWNMGAEKVEVVETIVISQPIFERMHDGVVNHKPIGVFESVI